MKLTISRPKTRELLWPRLFDIEREFFKDFFDNFGLSTDMEEWSPRADIYETDKEYRITCEMPGMNEKDIDIELKENVLTISGERKHSSEIKEENYHRREIYYGTFRRSFTIPAEVDVNKIKAKYENGILSITMPKKEGAKSKKIKINV